MRIIQLGVLLLGLLMVTACGGGGDSTDDGPVLDGDNDFGPVVVVTNLNDSGPGSLRQVLVDAPKAANVIFDTALPTGTITLLSPLKLERSVRIGGLSGTLGRHRIDGGNNVRLIELPGGTDISVEIFDLILADGAATWGAAIFGACTSLTLERVQVVGCAGAAVLGGGGAVAFNGQGFRATDCAFTANSATRGAAVFLQDCIGTFKRCSFYLNVATTGGGGAIRGWRTLLKCTNCSFLDNDALHATGGQGGAVHLRVGGTDAYASFYSCTFARNHATVGGGVFAEADPGDQVKLTMHACIIADNTGGTTPDLHLEDPASTVDGTYNVLGLGPIGNLFDGPNGNQVGDFITPKDPQLGLIEFDGIGRARRAPGAAGAAHDAVPSGQLMVSSGGGLLTEDQQGTPRPVAGMADVGAIEN